MMKSIIVLASLLLIPIAAIGYADDSICTQFHQKLSEMPHNQLSLNTDNFVSIFDGKQLDGCEVFYESNESLVSGDRVHDLYNELINSNGPYGQDFQQQAYHTNYPEINPIKSEIQVR